MAEDLWGRFGVPFVRGQGFPEKWVELALGGEFLGAQLGPTQDTEDGQWRFQLFASGALRTRLDGKWLVEKGLPPFSVGLQRPLVTTNRSPSQAGSFVRTPMGVIIHSRRSGLAWTEMPEYTATVNWAMNPTHGLAWNATIGPRCLSIHLPSDAWEWNARSPFSYQMLTVEFAQARPGDPVSDAQIDVFVWWFLEVARRRWPDLPATFVHHSELPTGIADGKTNVWPRGRGADRFRQRIHDRLAMAA